MASKTHKRLSIEELKAIVKPIAEEYGVDKVYLFGSVARGDHNKNSDYDFCIEKGKIKDFSSFSKLYQEIKNAVESEIDLVTTEAIPPETLNELKTEWVLIHE